MRFLLTALIFHFTIYRRLPSSDKIQPLWAEVTACLSLMLWFGVGLGGCANAFV